MKTKYIVKAASTSCCLFLTRNVEMDNGQIVPFGFKYCEQMDWQIAKFDTKDEAIAAYEEAKEYNGANYTPVILETLVEDNTD